VARRRGGYQRPSKPAAVSGPGALSARTDGNVPQLQRTGEGYGQNKAVNEQQSAAPISPQGAGAGGASPAGGAAGPPGFGPAGAFSPTQRPGEPPTAGLDFGPGAGAPQSRLPEDPYLLAKALYAVSPSPQLERIIARLSRA
jgi:hypothetical protein